MRDGLNTFCIECHKADNVARKTKNRANPTFRANEARAKAEYRQRTVGQAAAYTQAWRAENKEHLVEYSKSYRQANKAKYNFLCQKRKLDLMCRTPKWLQVDDLWIMSEAYVLADLRSRMFGFPWHVDHTIPLRGARVSGLHVPQNIRVIPGVENMRKTNKYEV
jgi:hypothetical protein